MSLGAGKAYVYTNDSISAIAVETHFDSCHRIFEKRSFPVLPEHALCTRTATLADCNESPRETNIPGEGRINQVDQKKRGNQL